MGWMTFFFLIVFGAAIVVATVALLELYNRKRQGAAPRQNIVKKAAQQERSRFFQQQAPAFRGHIKRAQNSSAQQPPELSRDFPSGENVIDLEEKRRKKREAEELEEKKEKAAKFLEESAEHERLPLAVRLQRAEERQQLFEKEREMQPRQKYKSHDDLEL